MSLSLTEGSNPSSQNTNGSTIISVELADSSTFKLPITNTTTPKALLSNISKKVGIVQIGFFGLQCSRSLIIQADSAIPLSASSKISVSSNATSNNEEDSVFLMDDTPILDQIIYGQKLKLGVSLKYGFVDPRKQLNDQTSMNFIYQELAKRLRLTQCDHLNKEVLVNLVSLQIHCKYQLSPGLSLSFLEDVKSFTPKIALSGVTLDSFTDDVLKSTKSMASSGLSFKDGVRNFLVLIKQNFPQWFNSSFSCLHTEYNQSLNLKVGPDGLILSSDKSDYELILPYRNITGWEFSAIKENRNSTPKSHPFIVTSSDEDKPANNHGKSSMSSSLSPSMLGESYLQAKDERKITYSSSLRLKNSTISKKSNKMVLDSFVAGKEKVYRYSLSLQPAEKNMSSIDLIILSSFWDDERVVELLSRYSKKPNSEQDNENDLDESSETETAILCVANCDHAAKSPDELMFLVGDEIKVLRKMGNNTYLGECQGFQGVFSGSMVTFNKKSQSISGSLTSLNNRHVSRAGEVVNIFMMDDTKRSFVVNSSITGKQVVKMMLEKLEINEGHMFDICQLKADGSELWILPHISLLDQISTLNLKLLFKARLLYLDVSELIDPKITYLYFIQVRHFVLGTLVQLSENDAIDFASLQMQQSFGDHDPEKQKGGYFKSSLDDFLPSYLLKTKNETWWQKKLFLAHQQHRGLSKTEAEKAYIAMSQKLLFYGYELFYPIVPDSFIIGISRDYVTLYERRSKNQTERMTLDFKDVSYSNQSLVLDLHFKQPSEKSVRLFSLEIFEITRTLDMLNEIDLYSKLKRKCKVIREYMNYFSQSIELLEPEGMVSPHDPEDLFDQLKNGIALKNLVFSISKLIPSLVNEHITDYTTGFPSSTLPSYQSVENMQAFINFCKETLKIDDQSCLINAEDACDYSAFFKLCELVLLMFQQKDISNKLIELKAKYKPSKLSIQSAKSVLTPEDFMKKVIEEIVETERTYVSDLKDIVESYYKPLERLKQQDSLANEVIQIFGNVSSLYELHRSFFVQIEPLKSDINNCGTIGKLFSDISEKLISFYEAYCFNHCDPADRLPDLSSSPALMDLFGFKGNPQNDQNAIRVLSSKIIKPVQRIMRYHLLLKELLRYTPETHSGHGILAEGLRKMKEVASNVNEIKRTRENERTLINLQSNVENYDGPAISSFGSLLLDGKMTMIDKSFFQSKSKFGTSKMDYSYSFFLFDEVILYFKEFKKPKGNSGIYRFKGAIPIESVTVEEKISDLSEVLDEADLKFSWEINRHDTQKSYILASLTLEDKERWLGLITKLKSKLLTATRRDIDWKKLKSLEAFTSSDSITTNSTIIRSKLTNTVRKLGGWKRDNTSETVVEQSEGSSGSIVVNSPQTPINDSVLRSSQSLQISTTPFEGTYLIAKQLEDLNITVKGLLDETKNSGTEIMQEKERSRLLEIELTRMKERNSIFDEIFLSGHFKLGSSTVSTDELLRRFDDEAKMRNELQEQMKKLNTLMKSFSLKNKV